MDRLSRIRHLTASSKTERSRRAGAEQQPAPPRSSTRSWGQHPTRARTTRRRPTGASRRLTENGRPRHRRQALSLHGAHRTSCARSGQPRRARCLDGKAFRGNPTRHAPRLGIRHTHCGTCTPGLTEPSPPPLWRAEICRRQWQHRFLTMYGRPCITQSPPFLDVMM
jgi:hypothetical protein